MKTKHKVIFGNCMSMEELPDNLCHLMFTSPPYFNAPFDYQGFFKDYEKFLGVIKKFASETYRVLKDGRIAVINIDDMLVNGTKYPIVADTIKIFQEAGFRYRDKIIWKKPDGYLRISRRSGVLLQNPYPMYFYPDNLLESIIIFQKGKFNYHSISERIRKLSKIDKEEFQQKKWYMTLWEITNVLPGSTLEKNIAAFPDELPYRIIKLFSYAGEIVLDPFLGSGTTMKVARKLQRHCIGFEIIRDLEETIRKKTGFNSSNITHQNNDIFEIQERKTGKYRFVKMDYIEQKKKKSSN
jgi:site-specific DNA-methyltransferase (adenine-specific)